METGMSIAGVILAAGTSSRMGSVNKLLLRYNNRTVIEEVLAQMAGSGVDSILIVTGFERARIEAALAGRVTDRMQLIYNGRYRLGRAESVKCAVEHLGGRFEAILFMVGDKPGVSGQLINRAIERFRRDRPAMLYVETPRGRGHPIIFSKAVFADLKSLKGDRIGDELVEKYKGDTIVLADDRQQIDIDTEDDYRMLLKNTNGN
jgi:molybdenum cofactor cytidylyltransferase